MGNLATRLPLLILESGVRCRFAQFKLVVHLLNFRILFFKTRSEIFFLLRELRLQFLHLTMFFEELVQQHRVHRFVAHGVGFALFVASHESGVHLFHLFSHEAELRDALGVKLRLVMEDDRLKREEGLRLRPSTTLQPRPLRFLRKPITNRASKNVKAKPLAKQNNEQDDYQNKAQTSARIVSPASAIWPCRQGGDQEQNQNYEQYGTHDFLI
jgi:hypothetical protein